jgi:phenylalanyl-tRNA synthetase beta subunit
VTSAAWLVTLPSWRLDLEREIDLIEEVARVYGYNRFANTLPAFGEGVRALPWAEKESAVRGRCWPPVSMRRLPARSARRRRPR